MKKLTLNLEALQVETFAAAETRHGEAFFTGPDNCVTISCGDSVNRPCEY